MQKQIFWILFLLASANCLRETSAYDAWYAAPRAYGGYGYGGYGYGGYGYGGGQTAYGAAASGMGQLVGAAGQYNKLTAEAEAEQQQARSKSIDNNKKVYQNRLEMQDETRKRNAQRARNEKADQARGEQFAAANRTPPLSSDDFDPSTGAIHWPEALASPEFKDLRTPLDSMFETVAKTGFTEQLTSQIGLQAGLMKDLLSRHILDMPLPTYTASRRFLDRMEATVKRN